MSTRLDSSRGSTIITRLPSCPLYHELSELKLKSGCYPNIDDDQLECAYKVLAIIKSEKLQFNIDEEMEFLKVLRFLRARKFNVDQAMIMIRADIKWRSENNRLNLRQMTAFEVLDCDLSSLYNYFPTWIQGYDKQHRPISWRKFGKFEIWNILKLTSMQQLIDFHAWESEQLLRLMYTRSKETGCNIETFTVVVDASGWRLTQATGDAYTFIKGMASTDGDHYPERLGTLIVVNAPAVLSWAWKAIQNLLDDVQRAKIGIYGTDPNEWMPVLQKIVDRKQIPVSYGGDLPDLAPEEALSSMNPPKRTGTVQFQDKDIDKDTSYLDSSPRKLIPSSQEIKICSDDPKLSCIAESAVAVEEITDQKSEKSAKSSAYTPSRNALMKAGWFGVLDNSVSSANDIAAANISVSRPKAILEVQVEVEEDVEEEQTRFDSRADHQPQKQLPRFSLPKGRSDQLVSLVPSQPMSPLQSPMRLIQHPKPTWNVDSSTQTGSSLKLNGRKQQPKISKECKSCVLT